MLLQHLLNKLVVQMSATGSKTTYVCFVCCIWCCYFLLVFIPSKWSDSLTYFAKEYTGLESVWYDLFQSGAAFQIVKSIFCSVPDSGDYGYFCKSA